MANLVLIIGESGTGKSTSIRTLDPKSTFLIQALNKPLPWKGSQAGYSAIAKDNPDGNLLQSDNSAKILKTLDHISEKMTTITDVVIDDFQYIMANEYMRRAKEKGWEKFTDIGQNTWNLIYLGGQLARPDLNIFFLSHSQTDDVGNTRCKTIGKMIDEKISLEGMFTIVLNTLVSDGNYLFSTQNNGRNTTKSPMGMFENPEIDNDLNAVSQKIREYYQ